MPNTSLLRRRTGIVRVHPLLGRKVQNAAGESLGTCEDLIFDPVQGRVVYAILSLSDLLGVTDKLFAVPLPALSCWPPGAPCILYVDNETLRHAPGFDRDRWPDMSERRWGEELYAHYGYSPYWA